MRRPDDGFSSLIRFSTMPEDFSRRFRSLYSDVEHNYDSSFLATTVDPSLDTGVCEVGYQQCILESSISKKLL